MNEQKLDLPTHWANFIFNGDDRGLTGWDRKHMPPKLESITSAGLRIVGMASESYYGKYAGDRCFMTTYTAVAH